MAGLSTNAPGLWGGFAGLLYGSTSLSTPPGFLADATPAWVPAGGVLAFEFDNGLGYNSRNLATTTPDSILTYTNPSAKMVYGSDGVLRYAPHNLLTNSNWAGNYSGDDWTPTGWAYTSATGTGTAAASARSTSDLSIRFETTAARQILSIGFAVVGGMNYRLSFDLEAMPVAINWLQIFTSATVGATIITYNGTGTNGLTPPTAGMIGTRVYIDFTAGSTGTMGLRLGCGVSSNITGDITISRPMITNLPIPGQTYFQNTSTTAAVYSLPIDHNPTTFAPLGVLIEEQRTNLCLYSDDFTNAAWVKINLTAAKTATGSDGVTNSASTLTATAANATARQNVTSASAARITSMFVKRRTGTGAVYLSQGGTTGSELVVNGTFTTDTTGWTASGATLAVVSSELEVTNTGAAAGIADSDAFATVVGTAYLVGYTARRGTSSSVGIEVRTTSGSAETSITLTNTSNVDGFLYFIASTTSTFIRVSSNQAVLGRTGYFDNLSVKAAVETTVTVTSDWTRVATASATITNPPLIIRMATSGDAIDVALFQHELGAFITSPIPTTNNPLGVTRLADQVSILTSAFAYNAAAGTVVAEVGTPPSGARIAGGGSSQGFVAGLTIGAATNNISGVFFNTTTWTFGVSNVGDSSVAFNGALDTHKIAWSFTPGGVDMQGAAYGTLAGTLCTNTPSNSASLRLGSRNVAGERMLCGHIKRLTYFPTRKTNAELQALTT